MVNDGFLRECDLMKKALLIGIAVLFLATGTAHAADMSLPKEFLGNWCVDGRPGGSTLWHFSHQSCIEPRSLYKEMYRDQDMIISPYGMNDCKAIKRVVTDDQRGSGKYHVHVYFKVYHMTYRCKNGDRTVKFWMRDDDPGGLFAEFK
jgi:hypothetical protein